MGVEALFVLFAIGLVCFVAFGWWASVKRRERLQTWARVNGWTYTSSDRSLVGFSRLQPFGLGHSKRATEVLTGTYDRHPALSFTYSWTTGSGKSSANHTAHIVGVSLPAYLPTVELTPDGLGAKLAKLVGAQDIQFESEDFNRAFRVASSDPQVAHAIVHPRLMERMLRPDAAGTTWRIEGTWILTWAMGSTDLDRLASRLGVLTAVADSIPRHVWLDHGFDPLSSSS
ncbi:DUF3137 domain-containing protein [Cellulomonas sp. URHE0023]|uniref:DUF3137 domain-containing protein n=1 Tax=Cellulomonas sp. URHE0023 TaxID=1380354 RepID=UPI00068D1B1D|nr:DUF3137 domain-containing protein [Cellulomonas sp. URHE0023]